MKLNKIKKKGTTEISGKIVVIILVILTVATVLMLIFKADILKWVGLLPSYETPGDKEIDASQMTDALKNLCPNQNIVGIINNNQILVLKDIKTSTEFYSTAPIVLLNSLVNDNRIGVNVEPEAGKAISTSQIIIGLIENGKDIKIIDTIFDEEQYKQNFAKYSNFPSVDILHQLNGAWINRDDAVVCRDKAYAPSVIVKQETKTIVYTVDPINNEIYSSSGQDTGLQITSVLAGILLKADADKFEQFFGVDVSPNKLAPLRPGKFTKNLDKTYTLDILYYGNYAKGYFEAGEKLTKEGFDGAILDKNKGTLTVTKTESLTQEQVDAVQDPVLRFITLSFVGQPITSSTKIPLELSSDGNYNELQDEIKNNHILLVSAKTDDSIIIESKNTKTFYKITKDSNDKWVIEKPTALNLNPNEDKLTLLKSALTEANNKKGSYSNNKDFVRSLYLNELITSEEYKDIAGVGIFKFEQNMDYVKKLLQDKIDPFPRDVSGSIACTSIKEKELCEKTNNKCKWVSGFLGLGGGCVYNE